MWVCDAPNLLGCRKVGAPAPRHLGGRCFNGSAATAAGKRAWATLVAGTTTAATRRLRFSKTLAQPPGVRAAPAGDFI